MTQSEVVSQSCRDSNENCLGLAPKSLHRIKFEGGPHSRVFELEWLNVLVEKDASGVGTAVLPIGPPGVPCSPI